MLLKNQGNGNNVVDTFTYDNNVISDPYGIANEFNKNFGDVDPSLALNMPCIIADICD